MPAAPSGPRGAGTGARGRPVEYDRIYRTRTPEGTSLAYATSGSGPALVTLMGSLSRLDHDADHPLIGPVLAQLQQHATCVRYDERGFGLSERDPVDRSLRGRVADLETVVDALGLGTFALVAAAVSGPVAIAYTARHPERVTHLVLASTFAAAAGIVPRVASRQARLAALIRDSWGADVLSRRLMSTLVLPGLDEESLGWLDEHQLLLAGPGSMATAYAAMCRTDASALVPRIKAPTLVVHSRTDLFAPYPEACRMAGQITGARFLSLGAGGHTFPTDPALMSRYGAEVAGFLATRPQPPGSPAVSPLARLSPREQTLLQLAADGLANAEIAEDLFISIRTVERHLSNVYLKLGVQGPAARTAAVSAYLRDPR